MFDEEENEELKRISESTSISFNHVAGVYDSLKRRIDLQKSKKEILEDTETVIRLATIPNVGCMTHDDIKKQIKKIREKYEKGE